jgi:NADH:ubiquinone oxidoreductase subunit 3 (subunit A)
MTPLAAYLLLFTIVGIGFIFAHLVAGKLIRPSKPDAEKGSIYECGEPTIGTAWVQFDLRFYVVALLFVIFDVEVAFFFPWAEVFGKANAVATAKRPETAEEHVAYAQKVQDLSLPARSANSKVAERYETITGRRADGSVIYDEDGKPKGPLNQAHVEEMTGLQAIAKEKNRKNVDLEYAIQREQDKNKKTELAKGKVTLTKEEAATLEYDGVLKTDEFTKNAEAASALAWSALIEVLVFFGVLLVGFAYLSAWRRAGSPRLRRVRLRLRCARRLPRRGRTEV